jgi:hypothetical protein
MLLVDKEGNYDLKDFSLVCGAISQPFLIQINS